MACPVLQFDVQELVCDEEFSKLVSQTGRNMYRYSIFIFSLIGRGVRLIDFVRIAARCDKANSILVPAFASAIISLNSWRTRDYGLNVCCARIKLGRFLRAHCIVLGDTVGCQRHDAESGQLNGQNENGECLWTVA